MQIEARGVSLGENRPGGRQLFDRAVNDHQKSVRLHGLFILQDAVPWNARAVKRGTERAQAADHDRAFDPGDDDRGEITEDHDAADDGDRQRDPAEKQAPQAAPESAALAPELNPGAPVIKADDFLFGMKSLAAAAG